jgi:hypothetical protein
LNKLLFSENYILKTKLTSRQICDRIAEKIEPLDHFRLEFITGNTKPYEGNVLPNSFEIRKIGSCRTSLLVFAKATISTRTSETQINIHIRPSVSALLFHALWIGIIVTIGLVSICTALTKDLKALLFIFLPVILLVLSGKNISFRRESEELKLFLATLLKG